MWKGQPFLSLIPTVSMLRHAGAKMFALVAGVKFEEGSRTNHHGVLDDAGGLDDEADQVAT